MFCPFIKKIDLYGKDPELYFKDKAIPTKQPG